MMVVIHERLRRGAYSGSFAALGIAAPGDPDCQH